MSITIPELHALKRDEIAVFGSDPALGGIEWTVLDHRGNQLLMMSRRPLKGDWIARQNELTGTEIDRLLREQWLPEWMDSQEQKLVMDGAKHLSAIAGPGIHPVIQLALC